MPRIALVLISLAACASSEASQPPSGLAAWLDNWDKIRECLASDGGDTRTGVAIAALVGRDCAEYFPTLTVDDRMIESTVWRTAIGIVETIRKTTDPTARASLIELVDRHVVTLSRSIRRKFKAPERGAPLPTSSELALPALAGTHDATFNAGLLRAFAARQELVRTTFSRNVPKDIYIHEQFSVPTFPSGSWLVESVNLDVFGLPNLVGAGDDGRDRLIVNRGSGHDFAYSFLASSDGGAHWRFQAAPRGTRLVDSWQDPRTGEFDLIVRDLDDTYLHHINPKGAQITVQSLRREPGPLHVSCRHGGVMWSLDGNGILEIGDRTRRWSLGGSTSDAQVDCRRDFAIVLRRDPDVIELCGTGCNRVFAPRAHLRGVAALDDHQHWIYAAAVDDVVAVWRQGRSSVQLFRMKQAAKLRALTVLDRENYLITDQDNRVEIREW